MDIDIVLGANMNPKVLNKTHVTNKKSLTLINKLINVKVNFDIKLINESI